MNLDQNSLLAPLTGDPHFRLYSFAAVIFHSMSFASVNIYLNPTDMSQGIHVKSDIIFVVGRLLQLATTFIRLGGVEWGETDQSGKNQPSFHLFAPIIRHHRRNLLHPISGAVPGRRQMCDPSTVDIDGHCQFFFRAEDGSLVHINADGECLPLVT